MNTIIILNKVVLGTSVNFHYMIVQGVEQHSPASYDVKLPNHFISFYLDILSPEATLKLAGFLPGCAEQNSSQNVCHIQLTSKISQVQHWI